jgi:signal transduction histidine kinase
MLTALLALSAAGVAAGYFAIAALIVPKIRLEDATPRFVRAFRVGGVAFFVGCGLTHSHIVVHTLSAGGERAEWHELAFHLMQVFGVWVFIYAALRFLDVRIVRRKTPQELESEALERRVSDLSRSNEDLEQFAHVVAHDLQEPLRTVSGFAELLQRRGATQADPATAEPLHHIADASRRMATMLDGVLAYSRVAGVGLHREEVDLDRVVHEIVGDLGRVVAERGAEVVVDALPVVEGDRVQLGQLVQNLVGNAIKFGDRSHPVVRITAEDSGDVWELAVHDNGPGIDPRDAERIFGMFQRGRNGEQAEGTGLGLALSEKIVHRHGGRIWAEAPPGGGTVLRFTLPKHVVTVADGLAPSAERAALV